MFFTQQLHPSLLPLPLLPPAIAILSTPNTQLLIQSLLDCGDSEERVEEKGRDDCKRVEDVSEHHEVPQ